MSASVLGMVDGRALGTSMRLIVTRPEALAAAKEAADRIIKAIDDVASRFREDSELSRVNREAGREVRISPLLAQAIAAALRGARLTDGAVDPTVGTAVKLAGYDRDFAALPPDGSPISLSVARVPGWQAIKFDDGARVVLVPAGAARLSTTTKRRSPSNRVGSRPRAQRCASGHEAVSSSTTSSIRPRACPSRGGGVPRALSRLRASMRTSRRRPRS